MIKTDAMYAELVHKIDQATESGQIDAIKNRLDAIEADIPADASSSNKFSTASDITRITEKIPEAASSSNKMATASDITGITELIPFNASTSNKLATISDISGLNEHTITPPSDQTLENALKSLAPYIAEHLSVHGGIIVEIPSMIINLRTWGFTKANSAIAAIWFQSIIANDSTTEISIDITSPYSVSMVSTGEIELTTTGINKITYYYI